MQFKWNPDKNKINIEKHGISFDEAIEAWKDPFNFVFYDESHSSEDEERWFLFGKIKNGRIIRVVYKESPENVFRIITAYSSKLIERTYNEENDRG
jgi:uncharacterized DUF497 family protein